MWKVVVGLLILIFAGYIAYNKATPPLNSREVIEAGVQQVKETAKLDPSQESLLRVQLAISDYIANSGGTPPGALKELVPKYFDQEPSDPITGVPYQYEREGMSYRLGGDFEVQKASGAVAGNVPAEAATGAENFINPNTMEIEDFIYDPNGKRNPFEPFDFSNKPVLDESIPPLERYSLGQLKVTAVLADSRGGTTAIVEDVSGKGYTVRVGTKIGDKNGVVAAIEKDTMSVVETLTDITGKEDKKVTEMKIQQANPKEKKKKGKK